ncbi:MAG: hypothetical protein ACI4KD_06615 [Oscillospiraceae bacterium]
MNKVLVEIVSPSTARSYEFWISKQMTVKEALDICVAEICAREGNNNIVPENGKLALFSQRLGIALNENYTVSQSGICGGDKLMIV